MQKKDDPGSALISFNVFLLVMMSHLMAVVPIFRRNFGKEAPGVWGLGSGIFIVLWAAAWPAHGNEMLVYLGVWIFFCLVRRMEGIKNRSRGMKLHRNYQGEPWIAAKLFPKLSEANLRAAEAFACMAIGGVMYKCGLKAAGSFVMMGFVSILFVECMNVELLNRRVDQMTDAEIENAQVADRLRRRRR